MVRQTVMLGTEEDWRWGGRLKSTVTVIVEVTSMLLMKPARCLPELWLCISMHVIAWHHR